MYVLRMPKPDENTAQVTIVAWLKAEGEIVAEGEDLLECVADKGEFNLYAEEGGTLRRVFAPANSVVPISYALAAIGGAEEEVPDVGPANEALMARARRELAASGDLAPRPAERVRATPAARRLARELGVELAAVAARTGAPLVREEDVRAFAADEGGSR
jgi:pyruvate dehydrogenase E2 component (dihydrolipoamide acetyltransferase)